MGQTLSSICGVNPLKKIHFFDKILFIYFIYLKNVDLIHYKIDTIIISLTLNYITFTLKINFKLTQFERNNALASVFAQHGKNLII